MSRLRALLTLATDRALAKAGFTLTGMGGDQAAYQRKTNGGEILITSHDHDGQAPEGENEMIRVSVYVEGVHEEIIEMRFGNVAAFLACVESFE